MSWAPRPRGSPAASSLWGRGVGASVTVVRLNDPDIDRRRLEINLRRRFGVTAAETGLAAEILNGNGRKAAARRRGISGATAKRNSLAFLRRL